MRHKSQHPPGVFYPFHSLLGSEGRIQFLQLP